jgi:hypothetical protein
MHGSGLQKEQQITQKSTRKYVKFDMIHTTHPSFPLPVSKLKGKAFPLHTMETGGGGIAPAHSRPRHLMGVSGQRHAPDGLYTPEKAPGTHWTGECVGLRASLKENPLASAGIEPRIARSSSP